MVRKTTSLLLKMSIICCSSFALNTVFWFLPSFTFVPKLEASINTTSSVFVLSKKTIDTLVPVVAKILDGDIEPVYSEVA